MLFEMTRLLESLWTEITLVGPVVSVLAHKLVSGTASWLTLYVPSFSYEYWLLNGDVITLVK